MKKNVFGRIAILLLFVLLFFTSCGYNQTAGSGMEVLPRLIVENPPNPSYLHEDFVGLSWEGKYKEYGSLQEALDKAVDYYNKTNDTDYLERLCRVIGREQENLQDGAEMVVTYYTRYFDTVWSDEDPDDEKDEAPIFFPETLCQALYDTGRKQECLDFIDRYVLYIQDYDSSFLNRTNLYSIFLNDDNVEQKYAIQIFDKLRQIEEEKYEQLDDGLRIGLLGAIARAAERSGKQQIAEEYYEKQMTVYREAVEKVS